MNRHLQRLCALASISAFGCQTLDLRAAGDLDAGLPDADASDTLVDTDGDGLNDGLEVDTICSSPIRADVPTPSGLTRPAAVTQTEDFKDRNRLVIICATGY